MKISRLRGISLWATSLILCSTFIPAFADDSAGSPPSDDAVIAKKVDALLSQMTLEEKIGQVTLFSDHSTITGPLGKPANLEKEVARGECGAVFNSISVARIRQLQKIAVEQTRLKIPLIFGYDVIHGYKTIFPIPLAMASSWNTNVEETAARIAATEAAAGGLNWTFAPMVDIARDPRWGRIAEGAGEDTYLGCQMAAAQVRGFQGNGLGNIDSVLACAKHFAAYGAVQAGRDYNTVDMSERTLREVYLPPYKAALDAGALSIMTSFNDLNGVPSTANKFLLTHILRDEWGFQGFVVTDYTSINELVAHGIALDAYDAGRLALNAGVDMDMQGGVYLNHLKEMIQRGDVTEPQIDAAVRRILTVKFRLGLFDDPYHFCNDEREKTSIYTPANLQIAREVAEKSMVLLKNSGSTLPLKPGLKIAVIGPLGQDHDDLFGSWNGQGNASHIATITAAITEANADGQTTFAKGCEINSNDTSHIVEAVAAAKQADVVVMTLGESSYMSGEAASRTSIGLPGAQSELLAAIKETGRPIVLVLLNGRPLTIQKESVMADAILEAWQPGSEGGHAIADVLFGKYNPSGRLTTTFPRNVGQIPLYYNAKSTGRPFDPADPTSKYKSRYIDSPNDPLYPFGFGLSYTKFEFPHLELSGTNFGPGGHLTATVHVVNAGPVDGIETVQLYIHNLTGGITHPVLELKGFQQVPLKAGEGRDVTFTVGEPELTCLRPDLTWGVIPGNYEICVGTDSRNWQSQKIQFQAK